MAIRLPVYERHVQLDAGAHTIARIHADDATGKAIARIGESMMGVARHWQAKNEQRERYLYMDQLTLLNTELRRIAYEVGQEYQPGIHDPNWYHEQVTLRSKPLIGAWVNNAPDSQKDRAVSHGRTLAAQVDIGAATMNSQIDKKYYGEKLKGTVAGFAAALKANPDSFEDAVKQYDETLKMTASLTGYEKETLRRADLTTLLKAAQEGLVLQGRVDDANILNETFTQRMDKEDRTQRGAPAVGGGGAGGGKIDRSQFKDQLTPQMVERLNTIVNGEVGHQAPDWKKQLQLETIFNRAAARGQTLEQVTKLYTGRGSDGYYPPETFRNGVPKSDEARDAFKERILAPVAGGSDVSTERLGFPATGNASAGVASRGVSSGRYTQHGNVSGGAVGGVTGAPGVETYVQEASRIEKPERITGGGTATAQAAPTFEEKAAADNRIVVDPVTRKMVRAGDMKGPERPTQLAEGPAKTTTDATAATEGEVSEDISARARDGATASRAPAPTTPGAPPVSPAPAPKSYWQSVRDANSILIDGKQLKISATDKMMKTALKGVVENDIRNIERFGVGAQMPPDLQKYFHAPSGEVSRELIANKLGEAAAIDWEERKLTAGKFHGVIADMELMSRDAIVDRLDAAKPVPGSYDLIRQEKSYDRALKYAQTLMEERNKDPARAAEAFPRVQELKDQLRQAQDANAENPSLSGEKKVLALQSQLADARMRAQTLLGIPAHEQSPITNADSERIASVLLDRSNPNAAKAADAVVKEIKAISGGNPDLEAKAFNSILSVAGVRKEDQEAVANRLARTNRPAAAGPDELYTDEAQRKEIKPRGPFIEEFANAMMGGGMGLASTPQEHVPEAKEGFVPGSKQLDAGHIRELLNDPSVEGIFDRMYGKGAAAYTLDDARSRGFPIGPRADYADNPEVMPYAGTGEGFPEQKQQADIYDPESINPIDITEIPTPEL